MSRTTTPIQRTLYRVLLYLYPPAFRREYGGLMAQAFSDRLADRGSRRTWVSIAGDLSLSLPQQAWRETVMSRRWMAEVTMLITIAMLTATSIGAGSPLVLVGGGVGFVAFVGLWSTDVSARREHCVKRTVAPKRWTWWTGLAAGMAGLYVIAAAAQMVSDPKATNVGAFGLMVGFASLVALGLHLRSRSHAAGYWMVIIAMVPALMFVWVIVPALVAAAVICGAALEISSGRDSPDDRNH